MRLSSLFAMSVVLACSLAACGSSPAAVDAAPQIDAMIDAPPALTGLGQKCGAGLPTCPANAPECIGFAGTNTYCTPRCLTGGTGTTNAQAQFTTFVPPPTPATCTAAFTGTVGVAQCGVILAITPMDSPLVASKAYTGIDLVCIVACGAANACPAGMACNTAIGGGCLPI